jgi:hypothetical protein
MMFKNVKKYEDQVQIISDFIKSLCTVIQKHVSHLFHINWVCTVYYANKLIYMP